MADRLMRADLDNDPIVLAHARALLTSSQDGATAYLDADIKDTDTMRTRAEVTRFFDGLRLVDPGVVLTHEWRPDSAEESAAPGVLWAGVAGKP